MNVPHSSSGQPCGFVRTRAPAPAAAHTPPACPAAEASTRRCPGQARQGKRVPGHTPQARKGPRSRLPTRLAATPCGHRRASRAGATPGPRPAGRQRRQRFLRQTREPQVAHDPGRPVAGQKDHRHRFRAPGAPGQPRSGHPRAIWHRRGHQAAGSTRSAPGGVAPASHFSARPQSACLPDLLGERQYAFAFRSGKIWDSLEVFQPPEEGRPRLPVFPPAVHERVGVPAEPLAVFRGQRGTRSQQAAVNIGVGSAPSANRPTINCLCPGDTIASNVPG